MGLFAIDFCFTFRIISSHSLYVCVCLCVCLRIFADLFKLLCLYSFAKTKVPFLELD
eukprot:m.158466 g.158466  ORF g.158466 m.158466 type:complete len:57 (+) comp13353_c0_seq11:90-260(+)